MTNFSAKEREVATPKPGAKVPQADVDGLRYFGAGRFYSYDSDHSEREILRPGYFDSVIDKGATQYHGALLFVTARAGKPDPEDWTTLILRIARIRGARGLAAETPTTVAIVARFHKATLAAHGGEALDDGAKAGKAAA